jgi:hypothetical protein
MENSDKSQKTGATPIPVGDLGGGKVFAVKKITPYIVAFVDGHGEKMVRRFDFCDDGTVYMQEEDKTSSVPQSWLVKAIQAKIAEKDNSVSKVIDAGTTPEQL